MRHGSHIFWLLLLLSCGSVAGCAVCTPPKQEYRKYRRSMRKQGWRMSQQGDSPAHMYSQRIIANVYSAS